MKFESFYCIIQIFIYESSVKLFQHDFGKACYIKEVLC